MNTEDYVTYEQAVKLKELEFSGEATGKYVDCPKDPTLFDGMLYQSWNLEKDEILAPTLSQAAKWLREKGLFIDIWLCAAGYSWTIEKCGNLNCNGTFVAKFDEESGDDEDSGMFTTYEKALSDAINKALEILKEE